VPEPGARREPAGKAKSSVTGSRDNYLENRRVCIKQLETTPARRQLLSPERQSTVLDSPLRNYESIHELRISSRKLLERTR